MEQSKYVRPMGFGEILDASVRLYRGNFIALVVAFLPVTVFYLLNNVFSAYYLGAGNVFSMEPAYAAPDYNILTLLLVFLLLLIIQLAVYPVAMGALIKVASDSVLQPPASIKEAYKFSLRNILGLVLTNVIMALILSVVIVIVLIIPLGVFAAVFAYAFMTAPLGSLSAMLGVLLIALILVALFLLIPAFVWTRWITAFPVMVNERVFYFDALSRSWELVKGRTLVTFAILFVMHLIPTIIQGTAFLFRLSSSTNVFVITVGAGLLVQAFLMPLVNCTRLIIYFELRARKEGFDVERRVEQLAGQQ